MRPGALGPYGSLRPGQLLRVGTPWGMHSPSPTPPVFPGVAGPWGPPALLLPSLWGLRRGQPGPGAPAAAASVASRWRWAPATRRGRSTAVQAAGSPCLWHGLGYQLRPQLLSSDILMRTRAGSREAWAARGSPPAMPGPPGPASSQTGVQRPVACSGKGPLARERPRGWGGEENR